MEGLKNHGSMMQGVASAAVAAIALCLVVGLNRIDAFDLISADAAYFKTCLGLMRDGLAPYRDFFVMHGPVYFGVGALLSKVLPSVDAASWTLGAFSLWMMTSSVVWLTCLAVTRGTEPRMTRHVWIAATLTAVLAISWAHLASFMPFGGRPKFLGLAWVLLSQVAMVRGRWSAAGAMLALACLTWQVLVVQAVGLTIAWVVIALYRGTPINRVTSAASRTVIAGVVSVAIVSMVIAMLGLWRPFVEHAVVFPLQFAVEPSVARAGPERGLRAPFQLFYRYVPPVITGVVLVGLAIHASIGLKMRSRRRASTDAGRFSAATLCLVGLVVLGATQSVLVTHGPNYVAPLILPLAGLAALGFSRVLASRGGVGVVGAIGIAMIALLAGRIAPPVQPDRAAAKAIAALAGGGATDALIVGDPLLRTLVGGHPSEFDVQWVHGRIAYIADREPGGCEGFAARLMKGNPEVVYLAPRAADLRPMLEPWLSTGYETSETLRWGGEPIYVRRPTSVSLLGPDGPRSSGP